MINNPTPDQLAAMWWESRDTRRDMIVSAWTPGGLTVRGHVISRGSMLMVRDETSGRYVEDIRPEWVRSARLCTPRPPAGL